MNRAPAVAGQHRVGVQPRVGATVVERDQDRMGGQVDRPAGVEVAELLERDRGVAGVIEQRHLLGELGRADGVELVGLAGEGGALRDAVVEQDGDAAGVSGRRAPDRPILGGERDGGRGRRPLVVGTAGDERRQDRAQHGDMRAKDRHHHG
jgi:hypothetical protein